MSTLQSTFFTALQYAQSIQSLLKTPKFGNCQTELGEEAPCLTLADLTSAFKDESQAESKFQELGKKLDGFISQELEREAVYDHP